MVDQDIDRGDASKDIEAILPDIVLDYTTHNRSMAEGWWIFKAGRPGPSWLGRRQSFSWP
jgi:hypothetical protein